MAKGGDQNKTMKLPFKEVYDLLCPKCQLALKKLLGEKIADKVMKE